MLCGGAKDRGKRLHGCSELGTNPLLALQSICRVHILTMAQQSRKEVSDKSLIPHQVHGDAPQALLLCPVSGSKAVFN